MGSALLSLGSRRRHRYQLHSSHLALCLSGLVLSRAGSWCHGLRGLQCCHASIHLSRQAAAGKPCFQGSTSFHLARSQHRRQRRLLPDCMAHLQGQGLLVGQHLADLPLSQAACQQLRHLLSMTAASLQHALVQEPPCQGEKPLKPLAQVVNYGQFAARIWLSACDCAEPLGASGRVLRGLRHLLERCAGMGALC